MVARVVDLWLPLQYLPGIIATLALIMINCIRQDDLMEIDPFDDATFCRCRAGGAFEWIRAGDE